MVKGVQFDNYRDTGDPKYAARVYNSQYVDELVFIDIDATNEGRETNWSIIESISKECFMPITIGGGVKSTDNIRQLLLSGADKVLLNSAVYNNYELISEGSSLFGNQCIVVGMDVKVEHGAYILYSNSGRKMQEISLEDHIKKVIEHGAGELFINNISNDGVMKGYNLELIQFVVSKSTIPVVACGGAGNFMHLVEAYRSTNVSGLAMASIFHFGDNNPIRARAHLKNYKIKIKEV